MSPKRRAARDDLWDRTPGGLFVPRRPTLPTRRFIGKLGMAVDCCDSPFATCEFCGTHDTEELTFTFSGTTYVRWTNPGNPSDTKTWYLDGSYALDRKTTGTGHTCVWDHAAYYTIEEYSSSEEYLYGYLSIAVTFSCSSTNVGWRVDVDFLRYAAGYVKIAGGYASISREYITSSSDDCASRYFANYADPETFNPGVWDFEETYYSTSWGASAIGSAA